MKYDKGYRDEEFYNVVSTIYRDITKTSKAPWLKEGVPERGIAYNPKSGTIFNGINSIVLEMRAAQKGYKTSQWLSYDEIDKLGVKIKTGEVPTPIAYVNKFSHQTDVNPANGKSFSGDNPQRRYYFMFNTEQLQGLELRNDKDFIVGKNITEQKIRNAIKNAKTNNLPTMKEKLVVNAINAAPKEMKTLVATLATYRLAQEFHIPHKPNLNDDMKKELTTKKITQDSLMRAIYQTEVSKNRLISTDNQLEHGQRRTVERAKKLNKGMEI